ncbi:MAG: hypothetical protein V3U29_04930 [Phycisphaeraceae bacterium]
MLREGNVITAWPTKLALAPRLAEMLQGELTGLSSGRAIQEPVLPDWPRPNVAQPPWEIESQWIANG